MERHRPLSPGTLVGFLAPLALLPASLLAVGSEFEREPLVQNAAARTHTILDGEWKYLLDPYEVWDSDLLPLRTDPFAVRARRGPGDLNERDFTNAGTLEVPGDWNSQEPELELYEGSVWYQTRFRLNPSAGKRYLLYFGAANYKARVALDGQEIGQHEGGFTPFHFDITAAVQGSDEHTLLVKVNNRRLPEGLPGLSSDWWNYGGLTRSVRILEVPSRFVREYSIRLDESLTSVSGWVQLGGDEPGNRVVQIELPELGVAASGRTDAQGRMVFSIADLAPRLWSPYDPKLYDVVVSTDSDELHDRVGLRSLAVEGSQILLNGQPIYLRGINTHEEVPIGRGRAHSREHAEQTLDWVQELNANFLRIAHYPHNEEIVRLADERGVLLWAEIPVYWQVDFSSEHTLKLARQMFEEIIARDRNRAAVALWSVANETPNTEQRLAFLSNLIEHVRSLDPSRLVTSALLPTADPRQLAAQLAKRARGEDAGAERFSIVLDDPLGELLDVVGHNAYYGWYYSSPLAEMLGLDDAAVRNAMLNSMRDFEWSMPYDKPLVFSEFGAGAKEGMRGDAGEVWTEDYQARALAAQLDMMSRIPFVRGTAPWILRDFRTPLRQLGGIQDGWNRKGMVSPEGRKKLAFDVVRKHYEALRNAAEEGAVVDD